MCIRDRCYVTFSVFFFLAFISGVVLGVLIDEQMFGILSVAVFYWIWSCCTSSSRYICNTTAIDQVYQNVDRAIKSAPVCTMRIECYHYETRVHTTKDSEGNTSTRTERHRVTTWTARQPFAFTLAIDQSPPSSTLHYLDVMHLVRLRTYKNISYSPQAMASYQYQKQMFIWMNRRDIHYDYLSLIHI